MVELPTKQAHKREKSKDIDKIDSTEQEREARFCTFLSKVDASVYVMQHK